MVKKITTILLLIVILSSLFIVVSSSVALAKIRPNYTVCYWIGWGLCMCCSGYGPYFQCDLANPRYCY